MPPKPKFTKEEIVFAAKEIVREKGLSALTAREVAEKLGSSPRPIFTVFKSMDEVMQAIRVEAMRRQWGILMPDCAGRQILLRHLRK